MRKFLFVLLCVTSLAASAQFKTVSMEHRYGVGSDSVKLFDYVQDWSSAIKANATIAWEHPQDAQHKNAFDEFPRTWDAKSYKAWRILTDYAPLAEYSAYLPGSAGDMLRYLMYKESDMAVKLIYFDDLIRMCDFRIENLDVLKKLPIGHGGQKDPDPLSKVISWKAHYYFTEGKQFPETVYSKATAYKYFADALRAVREQKGIKGEEVEDWLLTEFFASSTALYNSDKEKYYEQYLADFLDLRATCKHIYESATDESTFNKYFNALYYIGQDFEGTQASQVDQIDNHFKSTLESHKDDNAYILNALSLMMEFNDIPIADQNKAIDQYAEIAAKSPQSMTYHAAIAYALLQKKKADEIFGDSVKLASVKTEMRDYFELAQKLAKDQSEKAKTSYISAQVLNTELDPLLSNNREWVDKWALDQTGVETKYNEAIDYDPDHYAAVANLFMAQMNYAIGKAYYDIKRDGNRADRQQAYDFFKKSYDYAMIGRQELVRAGQQNIYEQGGLNTGTIDSRLATVLGNSQGYMNAISNYFAQYDAAMRKSQKMQEDNKRAKAEYDRYMAKKKAEADFWAGK